MNRPLSPCGAGQLNCAPPHTLPRIHYLAGKVNAPSRKINNLGCSQVSEHRLERIRSLTKWDITNSVRRLFPVFVEDGDLLLSSLNSKKFMEIQSAFLLVLRCLFGRFDGIVSFAPFDLRVTGCLPEIVQKLVPRIAFVSEFRRQNVEGTGRFRLVFFS